MIAKTNPKNPTTAAAKAMLDQERFFRQVIIPQRRKFLTFLRRALNDIYRQTNNRTPSLHERLAQGVAFFLKPSPRCAIRGWEHVLGTKTQKEAPTDGRDVEVK